MSYMKISSVTDPISSLQDLFQEQGYLLLKAFFPKELVLNARDSILEVLNEEGWGKFENDRFLAIDPVNRINSSNFYACIEMLMKKEILHKLSEYPILNWFLSAILGEPVFSHPRKMIRITYPYSMNPKDLVPPHQDIVYVKGERDTFTAWIPLGDYPPDKGGLQVASGTHQNGLFPISANSEGRFGCTAIEENVKYFDWNVAHYELGDLLIMHSLTLHRSGINESKEFRLSLDCRFSSELRTINEDQLLPPYHPKVLGWEFLCNHWEKKDRYKSFPSSLQLHPKDKNLADVLNTSSRFVE